MEIQKVRRPDYHPVPYAEFQTNPYRNTGEVLLGYKKEKEFLIQVYFRREEVENCPEYSSWRIRTFDVQLPSHIESVGILGTERRMIMDPPILYPKSIESVDLDSDKESGGRKLIIKTWQGLHLKSVSLDELKDMLEL